MNIGTTGIVVAALVCGTSVLAAAPRAPSVAGSGAPSTALATGSGMVVVNEFVPGAYVELRNTSKSTVDISGFGLWLCGSASVATEVRVGFGQTLSPQGFYVLASSSFTGSPVDQIYWDVLPGGGAMLLDPDHGWADGVAVAAGSPCGEGSPAPECGQVSTARDAVSADSGSNVADFACRPRSPGEPNP